MWMIAEDSKSNFNKNPSERPVSNLIEGALNNKFIKVLDKKR